MDPRFLSTGKASKVLGVHPNTLRIWYKENKIQGYTSDSGRFFFDINSIKNKVNTKKEELDDNRKKICYCRVSSRQQKNDLEKQVQYLESIYPEHDIIKDIGSGLNFKRPGLQKVVEQVLRGSVSELVVAHRDRLCRFGFELMQFIVESSGAKLVVLDETRLSPERELQQDLLNILHVFSCRMYGLRKYKKTLRETVAKCGTERDAKEEEGEKIENL